MQHAAHDQQQNIQLRTRTRSAASALPNTIPSTLGAAREADGKAGRGAVLLRVIRGVPCRKWLPKRCKHSLAVLPFDASDASPTVLGQHFDL